MTSLIHWSAGSLVGLTWSGSYFTSATFASLANGSCIASSMFSNGAALDQYLDFSYSVQTGAATVAGTSYMSLYLLPMNADGTTYGDGSLAVGGTFAGTPGSGYYVGVSSIGKVVASGAQATGQLPRIVIPPGSFILALQNNLGNALGTSTTLSVASVRSYDDGAG